MRTKRGWILGAWRLDHSGLLWRNRRIYLDLTDGFRQVDLTVETVLNCGGRKGISGEDIADLTSLLSFWVKRAQWREDFLRVESNVRRQLYPIPPALRFKSRIFCGLVDDGRGHRWPVSEADREIYGKARACEILREVRQKAFQEYRWLAGWRVWQTWEPTAE